jgi:hypothetical protein
MTEAGALGAPSTQCSCWPTFGPRERAAAVVQLMSSIIPTIRYQVCTVSRLDRGGIITRGLSGLPHVAYPDRIAGRTRTEATPMYEWLPPDIELSADTSEADWVVSRLRPWDENRIRVASFMPDAFERYARVLHPAGAGGGESRGIAWSEVASRLSKPFHPDVQLQELAGYGHLSRHPVLGNIQPRSGSLPLELLRSLMAFLDDRIDERQHWWFAMWDGSGRWRKGAHGGTDPFDDERGRVLRATPRVHAQSRDYFLMRGPLSAVIPLFEAAGRQSPALWWPEDRTLLLSTEVDAYSTYVGGSASLIEDLFGREDIEAVPSRLEASLDWGL